MLSQLQVNSYRVEKSDILSLSSQNKRAFLSFYCQIYENEKQISCRITANHRCPFRYFLLFIPQAGLPYERTSQL